MNSFTISGQLIDVINRSTYPATITVEEGQIVAIKKIDQGPDQYILPGFIDAHVHIESSMLVPTAFAKLAVVHGTVATISDPHEIANVCGVRGVEYMIENSKHTPLKIHFGAPSCVPATFFETAGAVIDSKAVASLLHSPDIWYLTEMMNYPGVLHNDPEVMDKLAAANAIGKPIDGHAPGLKGEDAKKYAAAGITTDHECFTIEEAKDKIAAGMKIIIREGSAAKNFEELAPLFSTHPESLMFCSDDKHPDDLVIGHINQLVKRALEKGYDLYDVLCAASLNVVEHYKIPVGLLRVKDPADFIVVDNTKDWNVLKTYINGELVAENGESLLQDHSVSYLNNFKAEHKEIGEFKVFTEKKTTQIRVIEALDGQLISNELLLDAKIVNKEIITDIDNDILKIAVVNRYELDAPIAVGFIKNFNLKSGALASTVAHDCHNIIAVGTTDEAIALAVNALIDSKGGIAVAIDETDVDVMPLPIAGLMTDVDGKLVAKEYARLDKMAKELGTPLKAPFMTLSFMALLVIPNLKLSDKGLFNGASFSFTPLEV